MKQKRLFILLGILVLVLAAGGAWFFMGGSGEEAPTKISVAKIRKHTVKKTVHVVKQTVPSKAAPKPGKAGTGKPGFTELFGMLPVDPSDNYFAGAMDFGLFMKKMGPRLSAEQRSKAEKMGIEACAGVVWAKGTITPQPYSVVCSISADPRLVEKELSKEEKTTEGVCGKSTKCLQLTGKNNKNPVYLAFKKGGFMVFANNGNTVASIATMRPNPARAKRWEAVLPIKKDHFGTFLLVGTPNEGGGPASGFTPSNLGKHSNVSISRVFARGDFGFISKGIKGKMSVEIRDIKNRKIVFSNMPGRILSLKPSLPADALIVGADLNSVRKSVAATIARYKGKGDPGLSKMEGRLFFELSFTGGRPLVYLKMVDLKENGPILKKLGKPGDQIDITTMINPFLAMFLGKTSFKRIKGGFVATNLTGGNLAPSKEGLRKSGALLKNLNTKGPLAIMAASPQRLTQGIISIIQPFVAKNPQLSKQIEELQKKENQESMPVRVAFFANSLLEYEVVVEYPK